VLRSSAERILTEVPDGALVLDVGGWASPFPRADWVVDLQPYETRGLYGYEGDPADERFDRSTWVQLDICGDPWPFADGQFDFAVCSHTLEDVRDPIRVCRELERVAHRGYVETPSRLEEQSFGVHGPWVGWSHHRWLVDRRDGSLRFVSKPGVLQAWDHFPGGHWETLSEEDRTLTFWWDGRLPSGERIFLVPEDLHAYLREIADPARPPLVPPPDGRVAATRSRGIAKLLRPRAGR
jgi:hypothetical protein